jgi:hypothetical protein
LKSEKEANRLSVYTISGVVRYSQVILQAGTIRFQSNSKLVLAPTEKNMNPPKSLTIIADSIEIADHAEITYDLDGLPGLDPDTPAPPTTTTAPGGANGGSSPGEGSFPQANNGGNGQPGNTGQKGIAGIDAPELEIFVGKVTQAYPDAITVNFKGQDGGQGGNGGDGGKGGDGQKGAASQASDSWYDGDECTREPGRGGNGGKGGDAGYPGRGGAGGNGGIVKVFALKPSLASIQTWKYIVNGGKGAPPGNPGKKGDGGAGGPQGDQNDPCPARPEYHGTDGPSGQSVVDVDSNWQTTYKGKDGLDGDAGTYELSGVPN